MLFLNLEEMGEVYCFDPNEKLLNSTCFRLPLDKVYSSSILRVVILTIGHYQIAAHPCSHE